MHQLKLLYDQYGDADIHRESIPIYHKKTKKTIHVQLKHDLHCMDTPSLSAIIGGNEVGANYFDAFIDGFDKNLKHEILNLSVEEVKGLEINDDVMRFRDKIRNLMLYNDKYKLSQSHYGIV